MLRFRHFQPFYLLYLVFPVSQSIMLYSSIYGHQKYIWLLGIVLSLGAQIALLIYTIAQEDKSALEGRLLEARHMMALEHTHYKEVEQRHEALARIRHDFNNQLAAVGQLIRNGNREDAVRLVQSLREAISYTDQSVYSDIPVVNAILTEKANACASKNITLDTDVNIAITTKLEPMLLCSVFSNLMDYAIHRVEASGKESRHIALNAYIDGDYLFVKSVTSFGLSVKDDNRQSFEERILASISEKYGGSLQYGAGEAHKSITISIHL
jgi:sensor histidine kinase regulating citrate/malate metabolism